MNFCTQTSDDCGDNLLQRVEELMPRFADAPLTKITSNFYLRDIDYIRDKFGNGWTEQLRLMVRKSVNAMKMQEVQNGE